MSSAHVLKIWNVFPYIIAEMQKTVEKLNFVEISQYNQVQCTKYHNSRLVRTTETHVQVIIPLQCRFYFSDHVTESSL